MTEERGRSILLDGAALEVARQLYALDTASMEQVQAINEEGNRRLTELREELEGRVNEVNKNSFVASQALFSQMTDLVGVPVRSEGFTEEEEIPFEGDGSFWVVDGTHIKAHGIAFLLRQDPKPHGFAEPPRDMDAFLNAVMGYGQ